MFLVYIFLKHCNSTLSQDDSLFGSKSVFIEINPF